MSPPRVTSSGSKRVRKSTQSKAARSKSGKSEKSEETKSKKRPSTLKKRLAGLVEDMVGKGIRLEEAQEQLERRFLIEVLERSDGNQCRAAKRMSVHRNTLRRKLQKHGLL